jgi:hypothetical protein
MLHSRTWKLYSIIFFTTDWLLKVERLVRTEQQMYWTWGILFVICAQWQRGVDRSCGQMSPSPSPASYWLLPRRIRPDFGKLNAGAWAYCRVCTQGHDVIIVDGPHTETSPLWSVRLALSTKRHAEWECFAIFAQLSLGHGVQNSRLIFSGPQIRGLESIN